MASLAWNSRNTAVLLRDQDSQAAGDTTGTHSAHAEMQKGRKDL